MRKLWGCILATLILLLMFCSANVFAAEEQKISTETNTVGVTYQTHVQNIGWEPTWAENGAKAGTEGFGLRLEGIQIKLAGDYPADGIIEYRTHVQNVGWEKYWSNNGVASGSQGMGLRLEGIQIRLINMPDYSVEYRTHVQNEGWETDWASNGETAGSEGKGLRLEGIQIRIVKNAADLTEYNEILKKVNVAKQTDYTSYSWDNLKTVVAANVVTSKDTQEEVDRVTEAIQAAYDLLESELLATVYKSSGTYGPSSGMEIVSKDVIIKAAGVTLQNMYIKGDLIISEEVGFGDATLNNVTVSGETYVRGGGKNSIHINNGNYKRITIQQTSSGHVRIVAVNASGLDVVIADDAEGENIILEGSFDTVEVNAPDMNITTQGTTAINKMTMGNAAKGSQVSLASNTSVERMIINGTTDIKGQGRIAKADVNADSVTYEKAPEQQTIGKNVKIPPKAPAVTIPVTGITVNSAASSATVSAGATLQMSAAVIPTNATNSKVSWTVEKGTGTATINSTGLLTAGTAGTITVKAAAQDSSGVTGTKVITINNLPAANIKPMSTTIDNGVSNPEITLTLTDDTFATDAKLVDSWVFDAGTTGLKISSVLISNKTKAIIQTEGYARAGTIALSAKSTALSKGSASGTISITVPSVAVTSISVIGDGGITGIIKDKGTLLMKSTIIPSSATNKDVTWSVAAETGMATIDSNGLLSALRNGTVVVTATAADGSKKTGTCTITITNQSESTISTTTKIENKAKDPTIVIALENDVFTEVATLADNWTIDTGTTGLSISKIEINGSKNQATIKTTGDAIAGVVKIQAKTKALSREGVSNEIMIIVPGIPVTEVGIDGGANVGSNLGVITSPATATVSYQWYRASTADGNYSPISGAISNNYSLTTNDANKYIKVKVTGIGKYGGEALSLPTAKIAIVPVNSIKVTGAGSVTAINTDNGTLQMQTEVLPENATYKSVSWTVTDGTGSALISTTGLLRAVTNGTVTVKAEATDDSTVFGIKEITLSNQMSSSASITSGSLAGCTILGSFVGGSTIATSNALTVSIPYESKTNAALVLTKEDTNSVIKYYKGTQPSNDSAYANTYLSGTTLAVADKDVIWLQVISEDGVVKKYYKVTLTVSPELSTDAGLKTVATLSDGSPGSQSGANADNAIAWDIDLANTKSTLSRTDITVATTAIFKLYTDSAFSTEIINADTVSLGLGDTTVYIKVTAQNTSNIKYYAVKINRALPLQTGIPAFTSGTPATFDTQLAVGSGTMGIATKLSYKWYRSANSTYEAETDVEIATIGTYTPVEADIGKYLIVRATSLDATGTAEVSTSSVVAKAAAPAVPAGPISGTFTAGGTSINLQGFTGSPTGLEAAVAIDGSTYDTYADLTVAADGKATISPLSDIATASTRVKIRVKETPTTLPGTELPITVLAGS